MVLLELKLAPEVKYYRDKEIDIHNLIRKDYDHAQSVYLVLRRACRRILNKITVWTSQSIKCAAHSSNRVSEIIEIVTEWSNRWIPVNVMKIITCSKMSSDPKIIWKQDNISLLFLRINVASTGSRSKLTTTTTSPWKLSSIIIVNFVPSNNISKLITNTNIRYYITYPLSSSNANVNLENTAFCDSTPVIPSFYMYNEIFMCVCMHVH